MTYATTFSGIDGWAYGLNACGWQLQWACECDPFCRAVHQKRYGVPIYPDIGTLHVSNPPRVDALIGSPPCPPFSVAGKKLGVSDARHLYPAFIESVRVLEPRWVLMEQVAGILSDRRAFGEYLGGLVSLGYCLVWHSIPACAVGAPHQRDRVWIIARSMANSERGRRREQLRTDETEQTLLETVGQESTFGIGSGGETVGNPKSARALPGEQRGQPFGGKPSSQTLEHAASAERDRIERDRDATGWTGPANRSVALGDTTSTGLEERQEQHARSEFQTTERNCNPLDHWRDAQAVQGQDGSVRIVKPGLPPLVNGSAGRVERIRSTGNAVVTAIPYLIGQAINEIERT